MKKIILLLALVLTTVTFAQEKITEGIITQKQSMSSSDEQMNAQLAMMGEMVMTTYFKKGKSRSEMNNPMAGETITIVDTDSKQLLMLSNNPMMGKKYIKQSTEAAKGDSENRIVEKTSETKTILGYVCTKYNVTMQKNGAEVKMVTYATEKLDIANKKDLKADDKIKGFALYTEATVNQMGAEIVVKIEVTDIKAATVDAAKFDMTVPEGYEKTDKLQGM